MGYYCNYYFAGWNICSKWGFPFLFLSYLTKTGYSCYQRWLSYFDGPCHYWFDLHKYGVVSIDENMTCNNDGYPREDTILCQTNTKQWLIPLVIEMYGCFHFHFDSLLIACAQTIIARHQRSSLVPSMFICHYWQCVSIALQRVQAIMILQQIVALGKGFLSLPHIIGSAPPSLTNLWQMTTFSS
jgi:hypothetical protein